LSEMELGTGKVFFPEVNPKDFVDSYEAHLSLANDLLDAIKDAAFVGYDAGENHELCHQRFIRIERLVEAYQASLVIFSEKYCEVRAAQRQSKVKAA
jgi:hypothetical protein